MHKKVKYSIVIVPLIAGVAILVVAPAGIVSFAMIMLCFGLELLLIVIKKGGKDVEKK